MNLLVTGAAGFIGSHTCEFLLTEGHHVLGVDNFRTGRRQNLAGVAHLKNFQLLEADLTEAAALEAAFARAKPSAVIHLAALVSVQESIQNPALNRRLNIEMTDAVARAAKRHGVKRIVFASSAAIYGQPETLPLPETAVPRPLSPYGSAKLAAENIVRSWAADTGATAISLRYFNVYGPRQDPASSYSGVISRFGRSFADGRPVTVWGDGRQTRDFIHVADVVRANCLAATRPKLAAAEINICTGQPTSLLDLLALLRKHYPAAPPARHAASKAGDILHSWGRRERAAEMLGFKAAVPLRRGLRAILPGIEK